MESKEELMREFRKQTSFVKKSIIKECFYHDKSKCKGTIKQSHSIQRNGKLSIIEGMVNGQNCIYTFTSFVPGIEVFMSDLKPIGKGEASTFFGFCDFHDTQIFSPIENFKFDGSDKHLFLHSYRSYAHSYHKKMEETNLYQNNSDFTNLLPESFTKSMREGQALSVNELKSQKKHLDECIETANYNGLEYFYYEKEGLYPFAVASVFSPKVSYKDKSMNNHINPNVPFSQPIITFLPDQTSTIAIIAAFPNDLKAINLINELYKLSDNKLEQAISSLIIANCENTFFSPLFWNSLSKTEKASLLQEFMDNTIGDKYHYTFFKSKFNFFDTRFEISNLNT